MAHTFSVPSITTEQMREVDRLMIQEYGIVLLQMMENAGRNLARLTASLAGGAAGRSVVVLVGQGNNGGGGMVAARHLSNMGAQVRLLLAGAADELVDVPAQQASILRRMGVEMMEAQATPAELLRQALQGADHVIDAVIGYSLAGPPRGPARHMIEWAEDAKAPCLSLDVPSGIDSTTGEAYGVHVTAEETMTLALPKTGLDAVGVGDLLLADIGIPTEVYRRAGIEVPIGLFGDGFTVSIRPAEPSIG